MFDTPWYSCDLSLVIQTDKVIFSKLSYKVAGLALLLTHTIHLKMNSVDVWCSVEAEVCYTAKSKKATSLFPLNSKAKLFCVFESICSSVTQFLFENQCEHMKTIRRCWNVLHGSGVDL